MVKNLHANAGDARDSGSVPGLERSPGVGSGNPLWYSCLENPMDRGAWWATIHGVAELDTTEATEHACMLPLKSGIVHQMRIPFKTAEHIGQHLGAK